VVSAPVLCIPTQDASFEVYTDASKEALGTVLTQAGHPCAFESKKLNNLEKNYPVHELELYAIIHALHAWKHYLMGAKFDKLGGWTFWLALILKFNTSLEKEM
jgi:hypothetical protein